MTSAEDYLSAVWKWSPTAPVTVAGHAITCPGCGRAEGIVYWLHPEETGVRAEHVCVPIQLTSLWSRSRQTFRRWDEPRVTPEDMRRHGVTLAQEIEPIRELAQQLRTARRETG